jgi:hypothetical protein
MSEGKIACQVTRHTAKSSPGASSPLGVQISRKWKGADSPPL